MRERHQTALRMREEGATFQAISDALHVSASRANLIYQRALEIQRGGGGRDGLGGDPDPA